MAVAHDDGIGAGRFIGAAVPRLEDRRLLTGHGRYVDDAYISSFAGFVPAEDPQLVVVIVLERPQSKLLGTLPAMAAFKAIATDALRYERVQPDRP